jgi:hypothetical protein
MPAKATNLLTLLRDLKKLLAVIDTLASFIPQTFPYPPVSACMHLHVQYTDAYAQASLPACVGLSAMAADSQKLCVYQCT